MTFTGPVDFKPKMISALRHYSLSKFKADLTAGIVVGIVALPLAIAFGIASGVSPSIGLITAIIGGFLVSAMGGCSVQIGGPTGAFIVIVYGIIAQFGLEGLAIATFMAGLILIFMGVFRMGTVIKFIPYPIVVGFTAGIALTIFSTQINDFLGLGLKDLPAAFIPKWGAYFRNFSAIDWQTTAVGVISLLIIILMPKISKRIPGALVSIIVMTFAAWLLSRLMPGFHVDTIGDRFGSMSTDIPQPHGFELNMDTINRLLQPAFTIAILGAIESLLSATVADGITGSRTNTNTELIGQGIANAVVPFFGGIPVTGAIARTMTNITNGGLIMVGYNMSGWRTVRAIFKNPKSDISVLAVTFLLTVVFDLTIAIEIGLLLAVILFLRRVMENTQIRVYSEQLDVAEGTEATTHEVLDVAQGVEIYEIDGPFFFGVATKFDELMRNSMARKPIVRIIRMRKVPFIDATGVHNLETLINSSQAEGIHVVLSGVNENVHRVLSSAHVEKLVGEDHICDHISKAVVLANRIALQKQSFSRPAY